MVFYNLHLLHALHGKQSIHLEGNEDIEGLFFKTVNLN